ncbi:MAG: hypothetical protein WCF18_02885 [Chthoniobacteraceae bacterium]
MSRALLVLILFACPLARAGDGVDPRKIPNLRFSITAPIPGRVIVSMQNSATTACLPRVERGTVFVGGKDHKKLVALRSAELTVEPHSSGEMSIPAAVLSTRALDRTQPFELSEVTVPALGALLDYFQSRDDVPRTTAQLLVLCVQEDVSFSKWRDFLARQSASESSASAPLPDEVATAIDALGVLRQLSPQRTFALASDAELKLRALRNPLARVKAMKLYGLELPDAPLPPELGTLLHTKPGDNCPICRQRALMQPREDGL